MTRSLAPILLLPLLACQAKSPPPTRASSASVEAPPPAPAETQTLAAAGYQLQLPQTWTIAPDDDPAFAYAQGPGADPPICMIELRRQERGDASKPEDYRRGRLRGRVQRMPGPSDDAAVLVHCATPRGLEWAAIEGAFDSLQPDRNYQHAATPANDGPIVELCTGTPVRQTYVCVRSRSGEVHCGISETDTLARVPDIGVSQQIACDGIRACSRATDGSVSCWVADGPAVARPEFQGARDLSGGCIVDANGKVHCRVHADGAKTTDEFAELVPLDNPALTLADVEHVLPGTTADAGCVLRSGALACWDRGDTLGLALPDHERVHALATPAEPRDLARFGARVCVAGPERWTCLSGDRPLVLDDCQRHACGCTLTGAMAFACEHEPLARPDARWFGRIGDVVVSDGACAALRDGTVLCRGIADGHAEDSPRIQQLLVGGRPGIVHALQLSASAKATN